MSGHFGTSVCGLCGACFRRRRKQGLFASASAGFAPRRLRTTSRSLAGLCVGFGPDPVARRRIRLQERCGRPGVGGLAHALRVVHAGKMLYGDAPRRQCRKARASLRNADMDERALWHVCMRFVRRLLPAKTKTRSFCVCVRRFCAAPPSDDKPEPGRPLRWLWP